ncbi:MAG: hypothetical protein ACKVP7_17685 [Hyphomicrobiaceae bacterium]
MLNTAKRGDRAEAEQDLLDYFTGLDLMMKTHNVGVFDAVVLLEMEADFEDIEAAKETE